MKKIIFSLCLCLLPSLSVGQELFTIDDVRIMHDAGVKVQFSGQRTAQVLPAETAPRELLRVELLDFSDASLYRIPPWLKRFTNLRRLDLSKNHLDADSDLLETLQAMPKLDVLNLSDNPLFQGDTAEQNLAPVWQKLSDLGELYLSGTQGAAKNFGSLAPLWSLKILDLSKNRINNEVSALELNKLAGLEELNLSANGISTFPRTGLPVRNLQLLDLSNNELTEIPYIDMNALKIWDLQGNGSVRLADDYGDMFSLKSIKKLQYDSGSDYDNLSKLPEGLRKKLDGIAAREKERLWKIACSKGIKIGQYIDHCDGTIIDTKTGLMWKRCSEGLEGVNCEVGKAEECKWDDAVSRFKHVEYAGYTDWRLPTIDELKTLVYCSKGVKDKDDGWCNDDSEEPTINQQAFPNTSLWYWSGSPYAVSSDYAWCVYFGSGYSDVVNRDYDVAVLLVRGGQ
ncbi:Leucine rich repeat-containing protein [Candidatus Electronema halotolerans]